MDVVVSVDRTVEIKESEKIDKYLDRSREKKKLLNMKVKVRLMVVMAGGTVPKIKQK